MKRILATAALVAGLAISAGACCPTVHGGVGTACQGDAHGITCR